MSSFLDRPDESQSDYTLNNHPRNKSKSIKDLIDEWQREVIFLRRCIQLPIVDSNSPLRREACLNLLSFVIHGHRNSCLLGNHVHETNPLAIRYGIDDLFIKPL